MRLALICIHYPPVRSSAAVQIRDLAQEFLAQGHEPVVLVPSEDINEPWIHEKLDDVDVIRLATHRTRGVGYARRTLGEFIMPFVMLRRLRRTPFGGIKWDAVVWYSPTIFFGPLVWKLKRFSGCRSYLILRDIFPEWAVDLGLMTRGPAYVFFKLMAILQYEMADCIGVQTHSNLTYLEKWASRSGRRLEVLQNWLAIAPDRGSTISISATKLAGRKIFVYIGNMGVAQGMDILVDLAERLIERRDIGFLFVGRGSESERLAAAARERGLDNTVFHQEVDSREMPGLLKQCCVGLLALDPRHKTHNIPGKFLTYLQAGLPVLARVNPGTDLVKLIESEQIGLAYVGEDVEVLARYAESLADDKTSRTAMSDKGRELGARMFSPTTAVRQIMAALTDAT